MTFQLLGGYAYGALLYLLVGLVFAIGYLPRTIRLQAKQYAKQRTRWLDGTVTLDAWLDTVSPGCARINALSAFLEFTRGRQFSLTAVGERFGLNLVLWPICLPYVLLTDVLRDWLVAAYRWLGRRLAVIARHLIQWANREALQDFAALTPKEGKK